MYGSNLPPELQLCITISTSACPKWSPGLSVLFPLPHLSYQKLPLISSPFSHQALSRLPLGCLNSSHFLASFCPHPRPGHHLKPEQPHSLSVPANLATRSHRVNPQPLKTLSPLGGYILGSQSLCGPSRHLSTHFIPPSLCSTASVPQTAPSHQGLHVFSYH